MNVAVVYGGRGLIDDPTLYVLEKIQGVLEELRVNITRINLYEEKNHISTMPARLKDVDGVILASSIEWFGIGGFMQEFLDACWLYGDPAKIANMYMMPIVVSTTTGERDALTSLVKAWEILGGKALDGICAYVENPVDFEMDREYAAFFDKKAEDYYKAVNHKRTTFPSSNTAIRNKVQKSKSLDLTPQESEQLSKFVSDDAYVKQQKKDIEELADMFKGMLDLDDGDDENQSESDVSSEQVRTTSVYEKPAIKGLDEGMLPTVDIKSTSKAGGINPETTVSDRAPRENANLNLNVAATTTTASNSAASAVESSANRSSGADQRRRAKSIPGDFKDRFKENFRGEAANVDATCVIIIVDRDEKLKLQVKDGGLIVGRAIDETGDIIIRLNSSVLNRITVGEMNFQRAFMSGDMKLKGDFKTLRIMDSLFRFAGE